MPESYKFSVPEINLLWFEVCISVQNPKQKTWEMLAEAGVSSSTVKQILFHQGLFFQKEPLLQK